MYQQNKPNEEQSPAHQQSRFAKVTFLKFLFWPAWGERKDHIRTESLIINIDYLIY